jgi:hypothetical protein
MRGSRRWVLGVEDKEMAEVRGHVSAIVEGELLFPDHKCDFLIRALATALHGLFVWPF